MSHSFTVHTYPTENVTSELFFSSRGNILFPGLSQSIIIISNSNIGLKIFAELILDSQYITLLQIPSFFIKFAKAGFCCQTLYYIK